MYEQITKHPTVREIWARRLSDSKVTSIEEADGVLKEKLDELAGVRRSITDGTFEFEDEPVADKPRQEVETALTEDQLREYQIGIHAVPEGFELSSKLARQWQRRAGAIDGPDARIDWAHAEALAFAAIVSEGIPIRLTGQDCRARHIQPAPSRLARSQGRTDDDAAADAAERNRQLRRSTTARSPKRPASVSNMATAVQAPERWCSGKGSSATSPTAPRS